MILGSGVVNASPLHWAGRLGAMEVASPERTVTNMIHVPPASAISLSERERGVGNVAAVCAHAAFGPAA